MKEIWKDIPGYEGFYQVSNMGNIKSLDRYIKHQKGGNRLIRGRFMKQQAQKNGYLSVMLQRDSKEKRISVHRLVALAFIKNQSGKPEVNHIDGNKLNNFANNLEWCTRVENYKHGRSLNLIKSIKGENNPAAKLNKSQVFDIVNLSKSGYSRKDMAEKYNVSISSIRRILINESWNHIAMTADY